MSDKVKIHRAQDIIAKGFLYTLTLWPLILLIIGMIQIDTYVPRDLECNKRSIELAIPMVGISILSIVGTLYLIIGQIHILSKILGDRR